MEQKQQIEQKKIIKLPKKRIKRKLSKHTFIKIPSISHFIYTYTLSIQILISNKNIFLYQIKILLN